METVPKGTPFTWITSSDRKSDISDILLPDMNLSIEEVYAVTTIKEAEIATIREGVTFIVVYSKHGVPAAKRIISASKEISDCRCVVVAIGKTTAATCEQNSLAVDAVATTPSVKGVAEAVRACCCSDC
eukprot:TRINITY_DN9569_c0_g1_i1.p1 TRINITY_DN9569_c0_g1~~TRINITY_DN9569_c0_g1_i1.p1  ORF type:complete len:129 (+),score=22.03 TRINITY_DN9569_c0_g1_i1:508-894(+)